MGYFSDKEVFFETIRNIKESIAESVNSLANVYDKELDKTEQKNIDLTDEIERLNETIDALNEEINKGVKPEKATTQKDDTGFNVGDMVRYMNTTFIIKEIKDNFATIENDDGDISITELEELEPIENEDVNRLVH